MNIINKIKNTWAKTQTKVICVLAILSLIVIVGKSATLSGTAGVGANYLNTNIFTSNGIVVYKITITTGTTNLLTGPSVITFWDSPYTTNFVNLPAYSNAVQVSGYFTNTFTNFAGGIQTNFFLVTSNKLISVAAAAQNFRNVWNVTIPIGTNTVVYSPTFPLLFELGICVTNNDTASNFTYSIEYLNYR